MTQFSFTLFLSKTRFKRFDSIEIRIINVPPEKKKKEAAVHHVHYSINQTLPLDGNSAFDQFFEKKKNEDSLKNKIDQKSRQRQLPSSTKNKEEKKKKKSREKGAWTTY